MLSVFLTRSGVLHEVSFRWLLDATKEKSILLILQMAASAGPTKHWVRYDNSCNLALLTLYFFAFGFDLSSIGGHQNVKSSEISVFHIL